MLGLTGWIADCVVYCRLLLLGYGVLVVMVLPFYLELNVTFLGGTQGLRERACGCWLVYSSL